MNPPNILILSMEGLRSDALGAYGNALARTPHLNALAAELFRTEDPLPEPTACW